MMARSQQKVDSLGTYLREIGRRPLLTPEQEITLGRQVQAMMHVADNDPNREAIALQGMRAKNKMVEANLRLVVAIAKKYQRWGVPLADIIQEGSIGLIRAVEKFDPEKGYKLSTYATWWIRQCIWRGIVERGRIIHLSRNLSENIEKIKRQSSKYFAAHGKHPSIEELAELTGLSVEKIRSTNIALRTATPIDGDSRVQDGDDDFFNLVPDRSQSPEAFAFEEETKAIADELLSLVDERDRYILKERAKKRSLNDLATELDLSRERVRQIQSNATRKLRIYASRWDLGEVDDRQIMVG